MGARSIGSLVLVLGLVTIPVKLYTARSEKRPEGRRLDRVTGSRVKQQNIAEADGRVLENTDIVAAYPCGPDSWVKLEPEDLQAVEAEGDPTHLRLSEVVPRATLDPLVLSGATLLAPAEGANRAYHLLAAELAHRDLVAVGQRTVRLRDELVVVAPHCSGEGLVLFECYYPDEVRLETLREVVPAGVQLSSLELDLACKLLDSLERPAFDGSRFTNGAPARLEAVIQRKARGAKIELPPPHPPGEPIDLLEQLRRSIPKRGPAKAKAGGRRGAMAS